MNRRQPPQIGRMTVKTKSRSRYARPKARFSDTRSDCRRRRHNCANGGQGAEDGVVTDLRSIPQVAVVGAGAPLMDLVPGKIGSS